MASYTVTWSKHATLVASTVDTITFNSDMPFVAVTNRSSTGTIYVRPSYISTTAPTVGGDDTIIIGPGQTKHIDAPDQLTTLKLISATADAYSVEASNGRLTTSGSSGAAGAAGESHIGEVGGRIAAVAAAELTRPSDTNAYLALDVISDSTSAPNVLTFSNVARINGGSGYVVGLRLMTDQKTNVAQYRLHLFHTAPTAINDNSPYLLLYANKANRIGHLDLPAAATEDATNSTSANTRNITDRMPFVCAGADRNIYGILETLTAFTPASAQKFYLELRADIN